MPQRSRTGCTTCRERKVKCDEQRPICNTCHRLTLSCTWIPQIRKQRTVRTPKQTKSQYQPAHGFAHPRPIRPKVLLSHPSCLGILGPILPVLDTSHIPCANSLLLSSTDRQCLEYFSSSNLVAWTGKPWKWSCLAYIYHKLAPRNAAIMYMIIASSASELQNLGHSYLRPASQHAARNYGIALNELNLLLDQDVKPDLDSSLTCLFLMAHYELKLGCSNQHLTVHLKGVEALLESGNYISALSRNKSLPSDENEMAEAEIQPFSSLSALLLVWIFYISLGSGLHTAPDSFITKLYHSVRSPDCFLVRTARKAHLQCWGSEYPQDEWLDDLENYRTLDLLHESFSLRSRVYQMWSTPDLEYRKLPLTEDGIFCQLQHMRQSYNDIFIMAKRTYRAPVGRALYTAQLAVVYYSGLLLFHRRMLYQDSLMEVSHLEALSTILHIAYETYAHDKRNMSPFSWGLEMAAIETHDPIYSGWIRDRFSEAPNNYRDSVIVSETLDQMKGATPSGDRPVRLNPALLSHPDSST